MMKRFLFVLTLFLIGIAPTHAALHIQSWTLANGARVLFVENHSIPILDVSVEFDAENPGQWMIHCHNTYHLEQGMAQVMAYKQSS